jgi:hypothetical protein
LIPDLQDFVVANVIAIEREDPWTRELRRSFMANPEKNFISSHCTKAVLIYLLPIVKRATVLFAKLYR